TIVEVSKSEKFKILGLDVELKPYVEKKVLDFLLKLRLKSKVKVKVASMAPVHVGLGSITQLLLSIGFGLVKLFNLKFSVEDVARLMGRGDVSGVGTYAFKLGGFLVDGGRKTDEPKSFPPLLFRFDFPKTWFFVVGVPEVERGFGDEAEKTALKRVRENLKDRFVGEASRIVLMKLLQSLTEKNIVEFGRALTMLQVEVGKMFSEVQGGVFKHPIIQQGIDFLVRNGAYGGGQSSWGPTFYGLVEGKTKAKILAERLTDFLVKGCGGGFAFFSNVNNSGVKVLVYK
ncbi:MAG: hypothetical protein DRO36_03270, partial [Candidatus Hecatellales archaeon]